MASEDPDEVPNYGQNRPTWIGVFFLSLVTSCAVVALASFVLVSRGMIAKKQEIAVAATVPSLTGLSVQKAAVLAQRYALRVLIQSKQHDDVVAQDVVLSQAPAPGAALPIDKSVRVVVSLGPKHMMLPDLSGQPLEQALRTIADLGLEQGPVLGPEQPQSVVVSTTPGPGTQMKAHDMVGFVVEQPLATVPKLIGMHWSRAKPVLEEAGFVVGSTEERYDSNYGGWIVLSQSIKPGEVVPKESTIDVVLNERD